MKISAVTKLFEERVFILQFVQTYDNIKAVTVNRKGEIRYYSIDDLTIIDSDYIR